MLWKVHMKGIKTNACTVHHLNDERCCPNTHCNLVPPSNHSNSIRGCNDMLWGCSKCNFIHSSAVYWLDKQVVVGLVALMLEKYLGDGLMSFYHNGAHRWCQGRRTNSHCWFSTFRTSSHLCCYHPRCPAWRVWSLDILKANKFHSDDGGTIHFYVHNFIYG